MTPPFTLSRSALQVAEMIKPLSTLRAQDMLSEVLKHHQALSHDVHTLRAALQVTNAQVNQHQKLNHLQREELKQTNRLLGHIIGQLKSCRQTFEHVRKARLNFARTLLKVPVDELNCQNPSDIALQDCAHYQGDARRRCHSKNRHIDARLINGSNLNFNTHSCTLSRFFITRYDLTI